MRFMMIAVFVVLGWAHEAMAQDAAMAHPATAYPNMAPIEQYLMERTAEIALARSAAPANSHKLRSIDELKKVTAGEGPDIVLWGSSTLYPPLLEALTAQSRPTLPFRAERGIPIPGGMLARAPWQL